MTSVLMSAHLLDEVRPPTWSGCVWCGRSTVEGGHELCRRMLDGSAWTPCLCCVGSGFDAAGTTCPGCYGVGFWESESLERLVGGAHVLDAEAIA